MRLIVLTAISLALLPSVAAAQSWQDWVKTNPTYGVPSAQPVPASAPSKPAPAPTGVNKYPPELRARFANACSTRAIENGATVSQANAFCGCIVNRLEATYTIEQLKQMSEAYVSTGAYQDSTIKAVLTPCLAATQ
jgi:hypothetical protein